VLPTLLLLQLLISDDARTMRDVAFDLHGICRAETFPSIFLSDHAMQHLPYRHPKRKRPKIRLDQLGYALPQTR